MNIMLGSNTMHNRMAARALLAALLLQEHTSQLKKARLLRLPQLQVLA